MAPLNLSDYKYSDDFFKFIIKENNSFDEISDNEEISENEFNTTEEELEES